VLTEKQEKDLVDFLAEVYIRIPWGKMRTRHNPHDIFNHRVRSAGRSATLYQFASRLNNYFGLQTQSEMAQELIDRLRPHENEVLNAIATEHIPLCVRACAIAKKIKEERRNKDGDN